MGKIKTRETKTMPTSNSQFSKGNERKNHRTKQEECSSLRRLGDSKRKVSSDWEGQVNVHGRGSNRAWLWKMFRLSTNENQTEILKNECGWFNLSRREPGRKVPNLEDRLKA